MRWPSGDQLGNPLLGVPSVRIFRFEPSAPIIINFAGLVLRAVKNAPNPKAIDRPSGDQLGRKAAPDGSENTIFLLEPSASITEIDAACLLRFSMSLTANFPSREKAGKTSV